jgi:Protein of unknown function (DUF3309)
LLNHDIDTALRSARASAPCVAVVKAGLINQAEVIHMLGTILLVVLILLLIGALPSWPHSRSWGYGPTGGIGLIVIVVIVLLVVGVI